MFIPKKHRCLLICKEVYLKVPIIKYSALEYWLDGTDRYYYLAPDAHTIEKDFNFKIDDDFACKLAKEYNLILPLNLMVPDNYKRNHTDQCQFYKWIKNIPRNSFYRLLDRGNEDENIYVCSPELTFCIAAKMFSPAETILIGNMLCATYVFDNNDGMKQRARQQITTSKKIKNYIDKAECFKGIKNARNAAKYIVDNCNSLREAQIATIASIPIKNGGYGMPEFEMNGEVHVRKEYSGGLGRKILKCDIVWQMEKVVVEYESNMTHLDKNQHRYDKRRSTALAGTGYKAIYITNDDINSLSKIDDTFFMIKKALHQRYSNAKFEQFIDLRYDVYNVVFRKNYFNAFCANKYLSEKNFS